MQFILLITERWRKDIIFCFIIIKYLQTLIFCVVFAFFEHLLYASMQ